MAQAAANMAQEDVEIAPQELRFRFALNKQMPSNIVIQNNGSARVGFKIKTTAPKKYVVRPSSGIADSKSAVSVQVIMQAQKEQPMDLSCKDKFMVQTVILAEGEELDKDTFNKDVRKDGLKEARLRVVLEGPAAPPSPVPEASEHDEEMSRTGDRSVASTYTAGPKPAASEQQTDISAAAAEVKALKMQLDRVTAEKDDLRRSLDVLHAQTLQSGGNSRAVSRRSITIVHVIIVAILAFLLGHFL